MPHDAMAGDGDRDFIGATSLGDGADCARLTDAPGDLGIACGFAWRNLPQSLPDALLKGRAAHIERQIEANARRFDEADDAGDELLEFRVAADQIGLREAILQVAGEFVGVVAEA